MENTSCFMFISEHVTVSRSYDMLSTLCKDTQV